MKIGVFDSGIGGITVLTELKRRYRSIDYVYLGDTAHLPYGTKSAAQIQLLSADCARTLKSKNVEAVVVACNTASSLALSVIQDVLDPIPVYGVVLPGVEAAVSAFLSISTQRENVPILVLATRATVRSQAYRNSLRLHFQNFFPKKEQVFLEQACPLLVPMIEEGWINHSVLHQTLAEYLKPYQKEAPGVALLGCTHYPWIHTAFENALPGWVVVNSARAVAESLEKSQWFMNEWAAHTTDPISEGHIEWIFTDPEALPIFAKQLIQQGEWGSHAERSGK